MYSVAFLVKIFNLSLGDDIGLTGEVYDDLKNIKKMI